MKAWCPVLLLALASPVGAAEWERLSAGDGDQYFYDRSKLFISGEEITYWKKVLFKHPQPVKDRFAASGLYRERIHCSEHTLQLISYLLYASDGSVIDYVASQEGNAAPIIPDTLGDMFEKTACQLVRQRREEQKHKAIEEARKTATVAPALPPAPPSAPPTASPDPSSSLTPAPPPPAPQSPDPTPKIPDLPNRAPDLN